MIQLPSIMMDRFSARMLVGCCVLLAIGLAAAAGTRMNAEPQVRFVSDHASPADHTDASLDSAQLAAYVISPVTEPAQPADGDMTNPLPPVARLATQGAAEPQLLAGRQVLMEVTAYCPCPRCCGVYADGITASGKPVSYNDSRFVAADTRLLPFGSRLVVPGYNDGQPVEVQDRGGAIKGHKLDLFFPTHDQALQWGRQRIVVSILD